MKAKTNNQRRLIEIVKRSQITSRPCAFVRDLDGILDTMEGWK